VQFGPEILVLSAFLIQGGSNYGAKGINENPRTQLGYCEAARWQLIDLLSGR